jgi:hypothetical protein
MLLNFEKWYKFFDRTVVGIPGALQGTGKVTNLLVDPLRESSEWVAGNFWFIRKDDIWDN